MINEGSIEIDAPPQLVWDVFSDVERWPEWADSFTSLVGQDGSTLAVGKRFAIKQPGLQKLVWEVTEIEPGKSWTWVHRSPGVHVIARHYVSALPGGRAQARQKLEQRGFLGVLVGKLTTKRTKRYLALEAQGLKAKSEERSRANGPHS
jgi:uncharacterized membrane protein